LHKISNNHLLLLIVAESRLRRVNFFPDPEPPTGPSLSCSAGGRLEAGERRANDDDEQRSSIVAIFGSSESTPSFLKI
jgi:hypothetical protein